MNIKKSLAISESGFVFDPSTGDSYTLNPMGLQLLIMLREGKGREEIIQDITNEYDVDAHTFERYFQDFMGMLKQMQLVNSHA